MLLVGRRRIAEQMLFAGHFLYGRLTERRRDLVKTKRASAVAGVCNLFGEQSRDSIGNPLVGSGSWSVVLWCHRKWPHNGMDGAHGR